MGAGRLVSAVPHGHWKISTFLAGLRHDRAIGPLIRTSFDPRCAASICDLRSIHISKTIDNDLMENDPHARLSLGGALRGPGVIGADLDNRSLPGVYVAAVMGRHAGF